MLNKKFNFNKTFFEMQFNQYPRSSNLLKK